MNVMVSINCITYNHEKYIRKAIEGFLMQKTNFNFEILIHDDASTDETAAIIKEYQKRYPDIIKPIIQKENQYSQGTKRIGYKFNHLRAKGKYIAYCEGDDCWIDPYKLQKQVDYMENNPGCTMCFHNAEIIDSEGLATKKFMIDKTLENKKITAGELAIFGFIPTASVLHIKSIIDNIPNWYFDSVVGDYPLQLINTSHGYAYYINDIMSYYRSGVQGSATDNFNKKSKRQKVEYIKGFIEVLDNFDKYSEYKYSSQIDQAKILREIQILEIKRDFKELKKERYKEYFNNLGVKGRIKCYARYCVPNLYTKLAKFKERQIRRK
ncbi:TPA: glycosyltransferase [Clostridium perfringens]